MAVWCSLGGVRRRVRSCCFIASVALSSAFAQAAPNDAAEGPTHGPARELWSEAQQLFEAGDFVAAADRFDRAYELEQTPLLGLWVARSLARAGRWVDALDRYREIAEQPLASDASSRDWSARRDAKAERQQLLPRMPSLIVNIDGAPSSEVTVEVNGALLPAEFFGLARSVDPGQLRVRAERGQQVVERSLVIAEAERKTLRLSFVAPPSEPQRALPEPPRAGRPGEARRVVSFIALGVGGATLLTGGVFAALAAGDEGRLLRACPTSRCAPRYRSSIDTYESKKTIATVGLWSGAALVASGLVLYFTLPRNDGKSSSLGPYLAGPEAGLWGTF